MAKHKRILGHAVIETAERRRACNHDRSKHVTCKGEACLVVKSGRFDKNTYCQACALKMIHAARADLDGLATGLQASPGS